MSAAHRQMTREEFRRWLTRAQVAIAVKPFEIVACDCGDVNCHGWRLVPPFDPDAPLDDRGLALRRLP